MTERLEGTCNRCGICCFSPDGEARCENLVVEGFPGDPDATRCGVWETRTHGMPIRMVRWDGTLAYESRCTVFAQQLAEGGRLVLPEGCTLTLHES